MRLPLKRPILLLIGMIVLTPLATASGADRSSQRPPNVIFIIADDLGVGELGCYGQKVIQTPRLDKLASEGMRFTQHNSAFPVCAPARCALMTGKHAGHCHIRDNGNPPGRKLNEQAGQFPGQNPIPDDAVTMAELFKRSGYATGAMGKWGLGFEESSGDPARQGFDEFFGYLCQVHAHNHYPRFLWHIRNGKHQQVKYSGNDRSATGETYSQDEFIRVAKEFLNRNHEQPFFLYLPLIVTHLSIQVPEDEPSLAHYRKVIKEEDYVHKGYIRHPTPRAAYAAMVTRMDRGIGEVLDLVDSFGLTDDTIVVFTSDNGPAYDRLGGSDSDFFNSNMGLRGMKGSMYEGGMRVPGIVRWPGHVPADKTSDLPTYFPDWMPTLLELTDAKAKAPAEIDGLSFAPTLLGHADGQKPHEFLYYEFRSYGGQQAVRSGDWKAIRTDLTKVRAGEDPQTELYNLADDPDESDNVAAEHPEIVQRLERIMAEQHRPSELFPLPGIDATKPARRNRANVN